MEYNRKTDAHYVSNDSGHFVRQRINSLLSKAVEKPLVVVCAGMGYGKTRAVFDFTQSRNISAIWIQLSELDNVASRFWKNYADAVGGIDKNIAGEFMELGFPDNDYKIKRYFQILERYNIRQLQLESLIILDDFHLIKDHSVINFIERVLNNTPSKFIYILICRELQQINILSLENKNLVFYIHEKDLNFTENELSQYFITQKLSVETQQVYEILEDTKGWAFSVNLVARSLKKSPGYWGYARSAMKQNVFKLIETEVWDAASSQLQHFWVCVSLIEHLSADLIALLCTDDNLLSEFRQQSTYVRFDNYSNTFLIHHLFLDFLRAKQDILTDDEKLATYKTSGDWCKRNGFIIDAISYYEKIGEYEAIISIFFDLPHIVPQSIAIYAFNVFNRAPSDSFTRIELFANRHLRALGSLGRWQEFVELAEYYEHELLKLPEDSDFRNKALGGVYFIWGVVRLLMGTMKDQYDYSLYTKMNECLTKSPIEPNQLRNIPVAQWINVVSSPRKGAPQELISTLSFIEEYVSQCVYGSMAGTSDLARGELMFYQSNVKIAETLILLGLKKAKENKQFDLEHRGLIYIMRLAVFQSNIPKVEQALKSIEAHLAEKEYSLRFFAYDIALAWRHILLRQQEMAPDWLKNDFEPYNHSLFNENFGNQMKARYYYLSKNYLPLLNYIENLQWEELALYGKTEMLAIKACARYQMKDKAGAFDSLREAYEMAAPNNILMPFVELGKDMRALTAAALRLSNSKIPLAWLKIVNQKSSFYSQQQAVFISNYKKRNDIIDEVVLSSREHEILNDLYFGFSKSEIAAKHNLSINTVKMITKNLFEKLGANNIAGIVRIAAERKLVQTDN